MNDSSRDQMLERPMPNSADSERAILGAILLDNSLIAEAVELLVPEDFYVPSHRRIFMAMLALFERGSEINPILIAEELKRGGEVESVGGLTFITNLTYGLPHFANIAAYAKIVKEKSLARALVKVCSKVTSEALEEEEEAETTLERAEQAIFALRDNRTAESLARINVLADESLAAADERRSSDKPLTGLTTGFVDLDQMTTGWQRTDLIVIAARTSVGKSALALNLAQNAAEQGASVGFFSLEMNKRQLTDRLLCSTARVDAHRYRSSFLSKDEWARLAGARGEIQSYKLFIDDTPGLSVLQLRAKGRRLAAQSGLDLIIVDYLQLMRAKAENRLQEVSAVSRGLKEVAKELNVPLIALAQLSRAPENRTDHRPILSDLRESGTIENDADVVAFIYREEMYNRTEETAGVAEIILAKQRTGPTGTVKLGFLKEFTRFENMWNDYAPRHVRPDVPFGEFKS